MEAGKILCNIDMIDPDLCDLSAVCNVTIDSFNEMIEGLKKVCSNLDAALTANSHQRSLLVDVHRHRRLHVFDPDLDLLVVAHRVEIFLLVDLVQVDKLSLHIFSINILRILHIELAN